MVDISYRLVVREAIETMKLPDSVKVAFESGDTVTVNRQKSPGMIWKDRQININFEKWPIALMSRGGGEWDTPKTEAEKILFKTIEINVAAPNGMAQLGRAIELLLGL